jgi:hypothetical protein
MTMKIEFKITESIHGVPCLEFKDASPELHAFLKSVINNRDIRTEANKITHAAGAFCQGGSDLTEGWIMIEFWKPKGAEQFVDFVARKWADLGC